MKYSKRHLMVWMTLRPMARQRGAVLLQPQLVRRAGLGIGPAQFFTWLAILGVEIGIFCDFLYRVLLSSVIVRLDFSGCALIRLQVRWPDTDVGAALYRRRRVVAALHRGRADGAAGWLRWRHDHRGPPWAVEPFRRCLVYNVI